MQMKTLARLTAHEKLDEIPGCSGHKPPMGWIGEALPTRPGRILVKNKPCWSYGFTVQRNEMVPATSSRSKRSRMERMRRSPSLMPVERDPSAANDEKLSRGSI